MSEQAWWLDPRHDRRPEGAVARRQHTLVQPKGFAHQVCRHCGLVALNNPATRHALRRGCWKYADE